MIHPTAIISREAKLADDVTVGPYAIVDGAVTVGARCVIQGHARLIGPLTMGMRNVVHSGAVLCDVPQDRKFRGEFSETIIGDDNIFREGATVHRGSGANAKTVIGDRCFFMANAHAGHNAVVGNDVTLVNGAALAGHTYVGDRAIISAYATVHQFCRVGRLALISGSVVMNVDFPPFFLTMATNTVHQLNAVGLRRSGMPRETINALRRMFQIAFREQQSRPLSAAREELPEDLLAVPEVQEMITFCGQAKRGVARYVPWSQRRGRVSAELQMEER